MHILISRLQLRWEGMKGLSHRLLGKQVMSGEKEARKGALSMTDSKENV